MQHSNPTEKTLESKYANLGYWSGDEDHADWTVEVKKAGKYTVWLDWACAPEAAGNTFDQWGADRFERDQAGAGGGEVMHDRVFWIELVHRRNRQ